MNDPLIIGILTGYLAILFAIGFWSRAQSRTIKGYFLAGKSLPSWVIAFSSNATGESAWLLLGLTGMGYLVGIHAFWIVLGEVFGVTVAWLCVARPFKAQTDKFDSITVPDFLVTLVTGEGPCEPARGRVHHHFRRWGDTFRDGGTRLVPGARRSRVRASRDELDAASPDVLRDLLLRSARR